MRWTLGIVCVLSFVLSSCGSSRSVGQTSCPWPEANAPSDLLVAADDLLAFQAVKNRPPVSLSELDLSNLSTNGAYAKVSYAYHPTGIGVLSEGWRIIIADDRIRKRGYIWCILRPPTRSSRLSGLRVCLVPLAEASEAGMLAGRGAVTEGISLVE